MRRKDREMGRQFGEQVIDKAEYGVLSVIDGEKPYALPLSIVRNDQVLYFHSAKAGKKVELLVNNAKVNVVFVGDKKIPENYTVNQLEEMKNDASKAIQFISSVFTTEYESAIVDGKVVKVLDEAEKIEAMRLICQKYTPDKMDYFDAAIDAGLKRTNVYKIKIDKLSAKRKKYDAQGIEMKWGRME